jgi:hypothetical protein
MTSSGGRMICVPLFTTSTASTVVVFASTI